MTTKMFCWAGNGSWRVTSAKKIVRHKIPYLLVALSLVLPGDLMSQGTFQNLNFESANLPVIPPGQSGGTVSSIVAIPSWQAFFGTTPINSITHNDVSLGAVNISILGPNYGSAIIEGNYTVSLQAGFNTDPNMRDASITQSGLVPASAQSLQIKTGIGAVDFNVALANQNLQLVVLGGGANYTLYGADISAFSGEVAELRITALRTAQRPLNPVSLDSIVFSTQTIPEPSAISILSIGAMLVGWRLRRLRTF